MVNGHTSAEAQLSWQGPLFAHLCQSQKQSINNIAQRQIKQFMQSLTQGLSASANCGSVVQDDPCEANTEGELWLITHCCLLNLCFHLFQQRSCSLRAMLKHEVLFALVNPPSLHYKAYRYQATAMLTSMFCITPFEGDLRDWIAGCFAQLLTDIRTDRLSQTIGWEKLSKLDV